MAKISPKPVRPPARDFNDARYWDERDLEGELKRVFEVCHSCRMCVNFCGSFPDLFGRVDRDIETKDAHGAELLDAKDFTSVTELCWQCKMCYVECPYTPDQGHEWMIDVPRLLMREKAQRAKRSGITIQDRALGEPGKLGSLMSGAFAPVSNFVNANRLMRKVNEKTLGISSKFNVPGFAAQTFESWLSKHKPLPEAGKAGTVAIFATCLGDYNFPKLAAATVLVLEKNGYAVERPRQECCGMPNLDGGDIDAARAKARFNVEQLLPLVEKGFPVIVPGPTCSYTIKKEWPELLGTPEAKKVAASTFEAMEFMERLRRDKTLVKEFTKGYGKVAYHAACHLRAQKIGTPGARILGLLPDTEVDIVEKCSAVDGTWGMKAQHYEMGRKYAQKLTRGIENVEPKLVVTDCPLSAQRIQQENDVTPLHPMEALAGAYGLDLEASS
ncbi:MAG: glycerol-3-phosphate dehydrogenase subunit [Myxococcales bacterium]|jgi:glycerol-3-phosphate dehydrogenase subunit C|nr:glycerol-3-phosphate dehydrogenase subunit [Myxococcales bacterium]